MAKNTKIEWCDHTFNPWEGCQKVGPGCDNCYAEARDVRFTGGTHWGPKAPRRRTSAANWAKPLQWNRDAAKSGTRPRVFCASLADVFDNAVDPQWRADLFELIRATPNLDWLLLTKRPGNITNMLPADWGTGWSNVWLGCTVVNQEEADRDVPKLLSVPAAVRFLSVEPMMGPMDLHPQCPNIRCAHLCKHACTASGDAECDRWLPTIDWVICGGESGPNARPMHPDWARSLRDQCVKAGVAFHFKQWGEWKPLGQTGLGEDEAYYHPAPETDPEASRRCKHDSLCLAPDGTAYSTGSAHQYHRMADGAFAGQGHMSCFRVGKAAAGRQLDFTTWDQFPKAQP